ncbi:MerR-like transcriptional regulator [Myxococcus phage Mx8]|uniref:Uoi n=1 Tax=Myxococcus phage Mx8 TaxID=49964 RepID=O03962_9CAUD|nr:MerR-like transcriptional regulator [Myxococcus phage Mx8]AAC48905.1 Uoi [Myxococcus phage Mx8]AAK94346.1 excisionase Uoi [Myxococcus phage Mx8]
MLTQTEAAALASVSTSTIRNWQAQGLLTAGHRGRVKKSELEAFLASPRAKATPEEEADAKAAAILARKAGRRRG